jgi:monoamine oxidase
MSKHDNKRKSVIIVGAGAAGLMAARELSAHFQITILEAAGRTGGRIRTMDDSGFPVKIEAGAEFVHGKLPLTLSLLKKAGLTVREIEGDMFQVTGGQLKEVEDMIEGWDELLKKMGKQKEDLTVKEFLDEYYNEPKHEPIRRHITGYVQGFDVADINKASVKELYKEWCHEDEKNFRIEAGYGKMIGFLESECVKYGCTIRTSHLVKQVTWEKGLVTVLTSNEKTFSADKLIITVPVPVLQHRHSAAAITFSPAIDQYFQAADGIGFGNVVKLMLLFKSAFWEDHQKNIAFIFSDKKFPTWWTQLPDKTALLTGWLGGPPANELNGQSNDAMIAIALESLAGIFKTDISYLQSMLVSGHVINWANEPYIMGAYSYATPASADSKQVLNTPLENTIYFAGEAVYEGSSPGTVEAALTSGMNVAKKVSIG